MSFEDVVLESFDQAAVEVGRGGLQAGLRHCLIAAERLVPYFNSFSVSTCWGSPPVLRDSIDAGWDFLCDRRMPEEDVHVLRLAVEETMPHCDDFASDDTGGALNAAIVAYLVLEFLAGNGRDVPERVAGLSADVAICRLLELEEVVAEGNYAGHLNSEERLVRAEVEFNKEVVEVSLSAHSNESIRDRYRGRWVGFAGRPA